MSFVSAYNSLSPVPVVDLTGSLATGRQFYEMIGFKNIETDRQGH